jgi:DNA-binding transcriptional LysR family regulator
LRTAPSIHCSAVSGISSLVQYAGAGLCVLPGFIAGDEKGLVRVLADEVSLTRSLWLIVHQDLSELARIKAVVKFIRDQVEATRMIFTLD